jgi:hypothetical protein
MIQVGLAAAVAGQGLVVGLHVAEVDARDAQGRSAGARIGSRRRGPRSPGPGSRTSGRRPAWHAETDAGRQEGPARLGPSRRIATLVLTLGALGLGDRLGPVRRQEGRVQRASVRCSSTTERDVGGQVQGFDDFDLQRASVDPDRFVAGYRRILTQIDFPRVYVDDTRSLRKRRVVCSVHQLAATDRHIPAPGGGRSRPGWRWPRGRRRCSRNRAPDSPTPPAAPPPCGRGPGGRGRPWSRSR